MFSKVAIFSFVLCALTSKGLATPLPKVQARGSQQVSISGAPSFNDWPIKSLNGFDDFYGQNNFDGSNNKQVIVQGHNVQCATIQVKVIQQRLAVIQELAKKVITEMICDVETQTVVWEQFYAGMGSFGRDIKRTSSRDIGYDSSVISHWGDFLNKDGSCSSDDWGFSGSDIGSSVICPSGNTWDDSKSPSSIGYLDWLSQKSIYQSQFYGSCDSGSSYSGSSYNGGSYSGSSSSYGGSSYNGGSSDSGSSYNGGSYNGGSSDSGSSYNGGSYNGGSYNGGSYEGGSYGGDSNNYSQGSDNSYTTYDSFSTAVYSSSGSYTTDIGSYESATASYSAYSSIITDSASIDVSSVVGATASDDSGLSVTATATDSASSASSTDDAEAGRR